MKTPSRTIAFAIASATLVGSASAALFIHEPFEYADTGGTSDGAYLGDGNQSGALGLTGSWSQIDNAGNGTASGTAVANEIEVRETGLSFTDGGGNGLVVTGGQATRDNRVGQTAAWSSVDAGATTALTADGTTMWMALLFQDRGFSGPDSFVGLTSQTVTASDSQALSAAGFGVGIGVNGVGGTARGIGTSVYDNATGQTFTPEATASLDGPGASDILLLAMKVNWNEFGTPDEIFVFNITDLTTEPDESAALADSTFDWTQADQNSLSLLSIGDSQVERFDEIRIGTTFADVAPIVPEPSGLLLLGMSGLLAAARRRR